MALLPKNVLICKKKSKRRSLRPFKLCKEIDNVSLKITVNFKQSKDNKENKPEKNINILNSDCLLEIFKYLSTYELIQAERVCQKWKEISLNIWKRKKKLTFHNFSDLRHFEDVLQRCGENIKYFRISSDSESGECDCLSTYFNDFCLLKYSRSVTIVLNIAFYCKNLEHLDFSGLHVIDDNALESLANFAVSKLVSLNLNGILNVTEKILSLILEKAVKLEKLSICSSRLIKGFSLMKLSNKCKYLDISYNSQLYKEFLVCAFRKLSNLEVIKATRVDISIQMLKYQKKIVSLYVDNTSFFEDFDEASLTPFPHLKILNASQSSHLTNNIISSFGRFWPNLEDLNLSGCAFTNEPIMQFDRNLSNFGIRELTKLSKLKHLKLNYLGKLNSKTVEDLANGLYKRLETFECKDCNEVNSRALSRMIDLCPKLKILDVSHSRHVSTKFLNTLLDSIKYRKNDMPLQIIVSNYYQNIDFVFLEKKFKKRHPLISIKNICIKKYDEEDEDDEEVKSYLELV